MTLTLGSLFDGIGGFPLAAIRQGITPLWASEIESFPIQVTKHHFPETLHMGDITRLDGAKLPPVDIICGGSPCQDLSVASCTRAGLAGARSGLFLEQIRVTKEMRDADIRRGRTGKSVRPRWLCWENVPGVFSSGFPKGEDFRFVLEQIAGIAGNSIPFTRPHPWGWQPAGKLRVGAAFSLAWKVFDAQYWPGTPQRRRRVFLVADFRGKCAGQILFVPKSLRGYFESGGTPRQALTSFAASSAGGTVPQDRYLSDTEVYCIVGNIIGRQPHNGGNGAGYQSDISYTLTGADRHAVVAPLVILNDQGGASMSVERSNISPTLRSQTHGNLPIIAAMSQSPPAMVSAGFRYKAGSAAGSIGYQEELAPTLMAYQPCGALVAQPERKYIVRRLTPMECERLQGFPDGWTAYDFEHGIISDSKRYEMLGNSVAVPCVAYIMQGIYQVLSERSV